MNIDVRFSINNEPPPVVMPEAIYAIGLHDRDSSDWNFEARNPNDSIPEVVKMGNGEYYDLVEPIEWLWYWSWAWRYPSLVKSGESVKYWLSKMRSNGAFDNKAGSDIRHSWVAGTLPRNGPMRSEGVECPGDAIYRLVDTKTVNVGGRESLKIWCLDYDWLASLTVAEARALAPILPNWLLHPAWDVHPDGSTTKWDYGFSTIPFSRTGETKWITENEHSFYCRANTMRLSRLKIL